MLGRPIGAAVRQWHARRRTTALALLLIMTGPLALGEEVVHSVTGPPVRPRSHRALHEIESRLRQGGALEKAEGVKQLKGIAHDYYRHGDHAKSQALFGEILELPSATPSLRLDAARMIGQIELFVRANPSAAIPHYETMAEIAQQLPEQQRRLGLGEAYEKLAWAYQQKGRYQEAIGARRKMLEKGDVRGRQVTAALLENARDHVKLKQYDQAVPAFDSVIQRKPGFKETPGRVVNIEIERVLAHGFPRADHRKLALLRDIWEDQGYREYWEIYNVGRQAVFQANQLGEVEVLEQIANDFLNRLRSRLGDATPEILAKYNLANAYAQVVITLATHYANEGNLHMALALYEGLLALFAEGDFRSYAIEQRDRVLKRMGVDHDHTIAEMGHGRSASGTGADKARGEGTTQAMASPGSDAGPDAKAAPAHATEQVTSSDTDSDKGPTDIFGTLVWIMGGAAVILIAAVLARRYMRRRP